MKLLTSVFLFAALLMMLGGLALMFDAGLQYLRKVRAEDRSDRT